MRTDNFETEGGGVQGGGARGQEKQKESGAEGSVRVQASSPGILLRKSFPLIFARGGGFSEGGWIRGTSEGRGL